ncbi:MAG TPA: hypothetical protein VFV38_11840 [Ktedonobacteraceae bacterium]|nr:hypothetical protein [Ktedonobacteraceae bacterium]
MLHDETREELMYRLGRESVEDGWLFEQDELSALDHFRALGDDDLINYTLGRLSTLDDENEVQR